MSTEPTWLQRLVLAGSAKHPVLLTLMMTIFGGAVGAGGIYLHAGSVTPSDRKICVFAAIGAVAVGSVTAYSMIVNRRRR